jgi:hypothetical protein
MQAGINAFSWSHGAIDLVTDERRRKYPTQRSHLDVANVATVPDAERTWIGVTSAGNEIYVSLLWISHPLR